MSAEAAKSTLLPPRDVLRCPICNCMAWLVERDPQKPDEAPSLRCMYCRNAPGIILA